MTEPTGRSLRMRELVAIDAAVALAYALLSPLSPGPRPASWLTWVVVAALAVAMAARRLAPVPVFLATFTVSIGAHLVGAITDPFLAAAYVLYLVAVNRPGRHRWLTVTVAALSFVGLVLALISGGRAVVIQIAWVVLGGVALGMAWTLGRLVRDRRLARRRAAEQLAEHAVVDERLRIARELHDIVAHSIGVIAVKAGVANHVMRVRPEEAEHALRDIETTSRSALTEMRQLLGLLRGPDPVELPKLSALPALVERAEAAGVRVRLAVDGVAELPEGLELTVYRIVQEALTNVAKHAAPTSCQVTVAGDGRQVRVSVTDDGVRAGLGEDGHGLVGMRERVLMYGGTFAAGPRPEGGFSVSARLPVPA
ncbi:sensor histidine kinase [Fodinicola acaciae]|uniref:sensor histidine kinase n=1 Tax=Fodinicola acaciae TaxID=2681555 RepID=UPI001C9E9F2C|nr:sensor histidine kinase [Fodinicola acaciae]